MARLLHASEKRLFINLGYATWEQIELIKVQPTPSQKERLLISSAILIIIFKE